jgi:hypothetical protein
MNTLTGSGAIGANIVRRVSADETTKISTDFHCRINHLFRKRINKPIFKHETKNHCFRPRYESS